MVRKDLDDFQRLNNNLKSQHLQLGLQSPFSCFLTYFPDHLDHLIPYFRTSLIENAANEPVEVFDTQNCILAYKIQINRISFLCLVRPQLYKKIRYDSME